MMRTGPAGKFWPCTAVAHAARPRAKIKSTRRFIPYVSLAALSARDVSLVVDPGQIQPVRRCNGCTGGAVAFLQRERKEGVSDWAIVAFGLGVAACILALVIATGYALVRVARGVPRAGLETGQPPAVRSAPRPAVVAR